MSHFLGKINITRCRLQMSLRVLEIAEGLHSFVNSHQIYHCSLVKHKIIKEKSERKKNQTKNVLLLF